jgi:hypothetical protein
MDLSKKSLEELQLLAKIHNINVPGNHRNRKLLENYLYKHINFKISNYQLVILLDIKIDSEFILYTKNCINYIKEYFDDVAYILFNELDFETFNVDRIKFDRIRIILQRKTPFTFNDFYFCKQLYKDNYILLQEVFLNPLEKNIVKFGFPENFHFDLDLESIFLTVL